MRSRQRRVEKAHFEGLLDGLGNRPRGMAIGRDADVILARQRGQAKGEQLRKSIVEEAVTEALATSGLHTQREAA